MTEIKAILQPVPAGPDAGRTARDRGLVGRHDEHIVKAGLEGMTPDAQVESVVAAIQRCARTGNPGDGGIFVTFVEAAVRIRTGESSTGCRGWERSSCVWGP